ncbi:MAG TPA: VOC family protein [Polyangiaceae bacterium]|nr:VOC family protein [Polyangiaceae bacterium]
MSHAINWFEIPARDMDRATRFWETVLGRSLKREVFGGVPHAIFAGGDDKAVSGALVSDGKRQPWGQGTLVYLDAGRDLDGCIARVVGAGGKVAVPRTEIGEHGAFAIVVDTEGNAVGLHAARAS